MAIKEAHDVRTVTDNFHIAKLYAKKWGIEDVQM